MKKSKLIKSTAIVMVMAIISRFIGLIRDLIISNSFDATNYTDAYKAASMIPETIFMIVGLAISTAFLPMLSKIKVESGNKEMHKFANNIINILFVISFIVFIIASMFPERIVDMIVSSAKPEVKVIATQLTKITLINIVFLAINACFTALLQVHEDFIIPSILGLFFNLPIILYMLIFKNANIYGLTIANVIGNFLRVLVQVPSLMKNGYRYKFYINLKDSRIKKILLLIIPVLIGSSANSLNLVVDTNIASRFDEGAISTLNNAQLLVNVVNTVITTAITTVIYPVLANKRNEGKNDEFIELLSKTVVYLAILLIPITAGMIIYGRDIVSIMFIKYSDRAKDLVTSSLLGYSIGIFFTGIRDVFNSTLFSMGKTKITAKNGVIGVIINIIFSITLSRYIGLVGITISSAIAMMVTAILLLKNIIKLQGNIDIKSLLEKIIKVLIATMVMTIVVLLINNLCNGIYPLVKIIIGAIIGAGVYFITIYKLKLEEVRDVINIALRKSEF